MTTVDNHAHTHVEHIHLNMGLTRTRNSIRNITVDTSNLEEDIEIEVPDVEDEITKLDRLSPVPNSLLGGKSKANTKSSLHINNLKDKASNARPILKQSSSYLDDRGSPIHKKEKSRNLQFADAIGKDLHEIKYSENLQYSPNSVNNGQFWDDNSTDEDELAIPGRACCTIS